jgi:hypothetical protein
MGQFKVPTALESTLGKSNRLAYETLAQAGGNRMTKRAVGDFDTGEG